MTNADRVAVLFSGQPRYIEECFQGIKSNLLDLYNCDVFAHFWWDDSYIGQKFKFHATDVYEKNELEIFKELYKPKALKYEPQIQFDVSKRNLSSGEQADLIGKNKENWTKEVAFKQLSFWYSTWQAYILSDNWPIYEQYVIMRPDLVLTKPIIFPKENDLFLAENDGNTICDWFATTNNIVALWSYCLLFSNIEFLSGDKVLTSTNLLKKQFEYMKQPYQSRDFGVSIFRGYKSPKHMDTYDFTKSEDLPYWMKP